MSQIILGYYTTSYKRLLVIIQPATQVWGLVYNQVHKIGVYYTIHPATQDCWLLYNQLQLIFGYNIDSYT